MAVVVAVRVRHGHYQPVNFDIRGLRLLLLRGEFLDQVLNDVDGCDWGDPFSCMNAFWCQELFFLTSRCQKYNNFKTYQSRSILPFCPLEPRCQSSQGVCFDSRDYFLCKVLSSSYPLFKIILCKMPSHQWIPISLCLDSLSQCLSCNSQLYPNWDMFRTISVHLTKLTR